MAVDDEAIVAEDIRRILEDGLIFNGQVDAEIDRHPTIPQAAGFGIDNYIGQFDVVVIRRG